MSTHHASTEMRDAQLLLIRVQGRGKSLGVHLWLGTTCVVASCALRAATRYHGVCRHARGRVKMCSHWQRRLQVLPMDTVSCLDQLNNDSLTGRNDD